MHVLGRGTRRLTRTPLPYANAYAMIQRRARAAGIRTRTTQLYDRRSDEVSLEEVERILI